MSEQAPEAQLWKSPSQIRSFLFYLDGLRYSQKMANVAFQRMKVTLDEISRRRTRNEECEVLVSSALLDAWAIVDMCHRARDLVQQVPRLSKNLSTVQIFLRATKPVDDLRNYAQHFRTQIPKLTPNCSPLWGALSWVPTWDGNTCFTIFPGNMIDGVQATTISYDRLESRFVTEVALLVDPHLLDLVAVSSHLETLRLGLIAWLDSLPGVTRSEGHTLITTLSVKHVATNSSETQSSA